MSKKPKAGFTIIEVLVAVTVLAIGTLVIAGGALGVTRQLVRSRGATAGVAQAQAKAEELRALSMSTSPGCTNALFASSSSPVTSNGITLSWIVPATGSQRTIQVISSYSLGRNQTHTDTLTSYVAC